MEDWCIREYFEFIGKISWKIIGWEFTYNLIIMLKAYSFLSYFLPKNLYKCGFKLKVESYRLFRNKKTYQTESKCEIFKYYVAQWTPVHTPRHKNIYYLNERKWHFIRVTSHKTESKPETHVTNSD